MPQKDQDEAAFGDLGPPVRPKKGASTAFDIPPSQRLNGATPQKAAENLISLGGKMTKNS